MGTEHAHRVCTYGEAEKAIKSHRNIYVNDCFCRGPAKAGKMPWKYCGHPIETCMGFRKPDPKTGHFKFRQITRAKALEMFENWKDEGNFFRFMESESWICFCCACGCGWFRDKKGNKKQDPCDPSPFIEKTNLKKCDSCGKCVRVCAYGARLLKKGSLVTKSAKCLGCSACEYVCAQDAISMVRRKARSTRRKP